MKGKKTQFILVSKLNASEYSFPVLGLIFLRHGDLSEEEKRAGREDLAEDELTVFDMLNKGKKVSDKEKAEVKIAASRLLERLKSNEFTVDHWVDKIQTAAAVKKAINDYLYEPIPYPTYEDGDIAVKTEVLFDYFKLRYADYNEAA